MASFRLYQFNAENRIERRFDFDADDDIAAIAFAKEECRGCAWEMWELGRLVARHNHRGEILA